MNGLDVHANPKKVRPLIGYLPEYPPLYLEMTVWEYLVFCFAIQKAKQPRTAHLNALCELTGVADVKKRLIRNLSKGYRQRVGLAQALIGDPPALILDEPTSGLDPIQIREIRGLLAQLAPARTILISSHILSEIQLICQRVLVIYNGRLIADDAAENLSEDGFVRLVEQQKRDKEGLPNVGGV
jgi:ABC-2 type transport system ATP-binding protein